jgi:ABC-2 type transport system ATP-binding protein
MSPFAVAINGVQKDFAGEKALKSLSLRIPTQSLFGVIGADGAGKTTLMRMLATLLDADSGTLSILNLDPKTEFVALRPRIGYMPQRFSLYADLTVAENMFFFSTLFGLSQEETTTRMKALLGFANLTAFTDRRAGDLSGGMKQKLALSCILLHEPELLLLDEPTVGVDPVARRDFWNMLKSLRDQGRTVLVSTPYMDEAEICSTLALMHQGELLALGSPAELISLYPYPMVALRSQSALRWSVSKPAPKPFRSIYPMGGELHAVVDAPASDAFQLSEEDLQRLASLLGVELDVEVVRPGIEDVFLGLLSGAVSQETYAKTLPKAEAVNRTSNTSTSLRPDHAGRKSDL